MTNPRNTTTHGGGSVGGAKDRAATGSNKVSLSATTATNTDDTATRCRVCGHPLRAERSRRRCLGPVCAHRIAQAITTATGHRAHVLVIGGDLVVRIGGAA